MHLAFECKNYGERIGVAKIGEFRDKLEDVGIPVQYGILIASEQGFTRDARERAASLGIRLLVLEGLTPNRLAAEVHDAFQSLVYLLPSVKAITITNEAAEGDALDMLFLRDRDGNHCGGILDLIWAKWRDGKIPTQLGEHHVDLEIPPGWQWVVRGQPIPSTASATVRVTGHVITVRGKDERFVLRDPATGGIERGRVNSTFDDERTTFPVMTVQTEEELDAVLEQPAVSRITIGRIPLPRIRYHIYWPPSGRVALELKRRSDAIVRAGIRTGNWTFDALERVSFEELEGTDLSTVWEPIWAAHPAAQDADWPWTKPRTRRGKAPTAPRLRQARSKRR
jgi:hypothetical protein